MSARPQIGIIVGSTRPVRVGRPVADGIASLIAADGAEPVMLDLAEVALPLLDEALPPASGVRTNAHSIAWAERIEALDGVVFVTPDYNSGYPAALKNAIDYLKQEWVGKPAAIVSYGWAGGAAAAAQLASVLGYIGLALDEEGVQMPFQQGDFDESMRLADPAAFVARSAEPLRALVGRIVAAASAELVDA
ncbi:NADPH-dependent FMN reductase [Agrococcus sp. HG114]|uniref:NADPH-dependent FMN reductase n=1 Tax=Agrococcus sp. HG114 TaxID=2969757 RepID=UPI00215AA8DC|nr:NAD(P)H-dependent oxidoreductase [Agrococcus sp. HG114]MCR8671876.1 NAD(P)H-dependent oxidoreductase [Agrococcus sp. HG114]